MHHTRSNIDSAHFMTTYTDMPDTSHFCHVCYFYRIWDDVNSRFTSLAKNGLILGVGYSLNMTSAALMIGEYHSSCITDTLEFSGNNMSVSLRILQTRALGFCCAVFMLL